MKITITNYQRIDDFTQNVEGNERRKKQWNERIRIRMRNVHDF